MATVARMSPMNPEYLNDTDSGIDALASIRLDTVLDRLLGGVRFKPPGL